MIQFFDPSTQIFVSGMDNIQLREQQAQQQLTTGRKINTVSDDPTDIADLMQVNSKLAQTQQIATNLGRVKTESDTAEQALQNAVTLMDSASSLASEGEPSSQSADTRTQLANQVGSVLQQMAAVANTNVENRYVFSGDADQTAPYSVDLTQTNPVSAYQGSAATRQVQAPDGSVFPDSLTAQDIFDSSNPASNVFSTLSNLRTALLNNDQAGIDSSISNLQSSSQYLNDQLAFYGTVQDRVASATNDAANLTTSLQTQQASISDADETQAITNLTMASTQQQAALAAEGQMPRTSLFSYLG